MVKVFICRLFPRYSVDVRPGEISDQSSPKKDEATSGETSTSSDTSSENGAGMV